ncbi:MAG: T9SS type A sorting domain-containing protein [bacterium]|nr:T9SS type A sorting domain-containing protein [bacterium]
MKIVIKIFLIISGLLTNSFLYALELHNLELVAELSAPDTNFPAGFGCAIVSGDLNGDGYSDIVVGGGLLGEDTSNCVSIYYGGVTLHTTPDLIIKEQSGDHYGWRFGDNIEIGDINKDGFDDIIAMGGAHTRIYYGSAIMDTIPDLIAEYGSSGNASGRCGDFNSDGYDDWVIPNYDWNGGKGKTDIFFGGFTPNATPGVILYSESGGGNFGWTIRSDYDVNNDGYDDLFISAPWYTGTWGYQGKTYIYYGGNPIDTVPDLTMLGKSGGDEFGEAIALTPDLNNDGYDDAFVGDPLSVVHDTVYGYWGGNPMNNAEDMIFADSGTYYGYAIGGAKKVLTSGEKVLIVGACGYYLTYPICKGKIYIYLGGNSLDTTTEAYAIGADNVEIGWRVADAGDINGDGYNEIMFSNYAANNTPHKVWVCKYTGPGVEENSDFGFWNAELTAKPNPFIRSTVISYSISGGFRSTQQAKDKVGQGFSLAIYDISGKLVENIVTTSLLHSKVNIGKNLKSGIYFVKAGDSKPIKIVKMSCL